MISHVTIAKGRLGRNPALNGLPEDCPYTCMCVVCDAGDHVVSLWVYAFGELATLISENLRKGDEVNLKAETKSNTGKCKVPRIGAVDLLVITEIEVDGKVFAS